jgi:hypothetical protein
VNQIIKDIEKNLSILINTELSDIGRAGNMLWMAFGNDVAVTDFFTKQQRTVSKYALHVSCAWRIFYNDEIIVASRDFYILREDINNEDTDWDVLGNNRFDIKVSEIIKKIKVTPIHVIEIHADMLGGFSISFDNGYVMDVFPDDSLKEEYWRFFHNDNKESPHFVVFDDK